VGKDDNTIAEVLRTSPKFSIDQRVAFDRLPLMKKQTGEIALRYLNGTVINNRLRAMPPAAIEEHATEYDTHVLEAAHRLVGVSPMHGDQYDTQLRWPLRVGGFGFTSALEIAPAAYLAGLTCTLSSSPAFHTQWTKCTQLPTAWLMNDSIKDSLERIQLTELQLIQQCRPGLLADVSASVLPNDPTQFLPHVRALPPSCLIQSAVSHRISQLSHIARVTQAERRGVEGQAELARLRSLTETESSLWLRVLPTDRYRQLTDLKWQVAAQIRLGMPVPVYETKGPKPLCSHTELANSDGYHPLVCVARAGRAFTDRHNMVVNRLAYAARLLNVHTRTEPARLAANDERRPDIQLDLPEMTLLSDVTISHPLAAQWQTVVIERGIEAVGDAREAGKNKLYTNMAEEINMKFRAFVLYTYGGFHKSALQLIKMMTKAIDPATCLTSHTQWRQDLMEHIAIAVQRGNADIMIQDAQRMRGRRWIRRVPLRAGSHPTTHPHHSTASCSHSRVRKRASTINEDDRQQAMYERAMAHVNCMIGLDELGQPFPDDDYIELDSDTDTVTVPDDPISLGVQTIPSTSPSHPPLSSSPSSGGGANEQRANSMITSVPSSVQQNGSDSDEVMPMADPPSDQHSTAAVIAHPVNRYDGVEVMRVRMEMEEEKAEEVRRDAVGLVGVSGV
jgi:hypothetical protein